MQKKESEFQAEFKRIAPLFGCLFVVIPNVLPLDKDGKVIKSGEIHISRKLPCDGILATSNGNYLIECKYNNNTLLAHQKKTMKDVNKINNSYYVIRKRIVVDKTKATVQRVYEDNKKKYGILTCYLCFKPIVNNDDCLEHSTPLSRGGNNNYDNLGVAHLNCNSKKHTMTLKEWNEKDKDYIHC